jgi:tRNA(Ile)-lysidine synthase
MGGPDPAVAAGRSAVRRWLERSTEGPAGQAPLVLVACSGGTDSLALAAVTAFAAPRAGWRAGAVIVDHGLIDGSAAVAQTAANQCRALGLDPVVVKTTEVDRQSPDGIEAAARRARYGVIEQAAAAAGAAHVLLAHTEDDQAETVLLALARGSGATALAGMAPERGIFARPFLGLTRATTEQIIAAHGLDAWQDPTNFPQGPYNSVRSQIRANLIPLAKTILGPSFSQALARTAAQLRLDLDYLDAQGLGLLERAETTGPAASDKDVRLALDVAFLAGQHPAVRRRALHRAAVAAGAVGGGLKSSQIEAIDQLVANWHGQGPVSLPGRVTVARKCGKLEFRVNTPGALGESRLGR